MSKSINGGNSPDDRSFANGNGPDDGGKDWQLTQVRPAHWWLLA